LRASLWKSVLGDKKDELMQPYNAYAQLAKIQQPFLTAYFIATVGLSQCKTCVCAAWLAKLSDRLRTTVERKNVCMGCQP